MCPGLFPAATSGKVGHPSNRLLHLPSFPPAAHPAAPVPPPGKDEGEATKLNPPAPPRSFWQRRLRGPVVALLTQGLTADRIALTLGVGSACSMFPLLGFSSLLNLVVGLWLRLNQPILQILNQALGPVHLVMIIAYVRLGEWLWRVEGGRFTLREMLHVFRDESVGEFLRSFGWAGIYALTAWALTTPVLVAVVYFTLRPALRRLAARTSAGA